MESQHLVGDNGAEQRLPAGPRPHVFHNFLWNRIEQTQFSDDEIWPSEKINVSQNVPGQLLGECRLLGWESNNVKRLMCLVLTLLRTGALLPSGREEK